MPVVTVLSDDFSSGFNSGTGTWSATAGWTTSAGAAYRTSSGAGGGTLCVLMPNWSTPSSGARTATVEFSNVQYGSGLSVGEIDSGTVGYGFGVFLRAGSVTPYFEVDYGSNNPNLGTNEFANRSFLAIRPDGTPILPGQAVTIAIRVSPTTASPKRVVVLIDGAIMYASSWTGATGGADNWASASSSTYGMSIHSTSTDARVTSASFVAYSALGGTTTFLEDTFNRADGIYDPNAGAVLHPGIANNEADNTSFRGAGLSISSNRLAIASGINFITLSPTDEPALAGVYRPLDYASRTPMIEFTYISGDVRVGLSDVSTAGYTAGSNTNPDTINSSMFIRVTGTQVIVGGTDKAALTGVVTTNVSVASGTVFRLYLNGTTNTPYYTTSITSHGTNTNASAPLTAPTFHQAQSPSPAGLYLHSTSSGVIDSLKQTETTPSSYPDAPNTSAIVATVYSGYPKQDQGNV